MHQATIDAIWNHLKGTDLTLGLSKADLSLLPSTGLAHDHIRIGQETGWLARVPKQSQWERPAQDNLTYQAACFQRVGDTRAGPFMRQVIPVSDALPFGALIVAYVEGRPSVLPDDLPLIAECLAKIHAAPLPQDLAPLEDHKDPVIPALAEIRTQLSYLDKLDLPQEQADWIRSKVHWLATLSWPETSIQTLCGTDTHPGNFLIRGDMAVMVDLEKCLYGNPAIDLAHTSVYTSTTWEQSGTAILTPDQVVDFYETHLELLPPELETALRPWLWPMRWLLYLRAITWCCKYLAEQNRQGSGWSNAKNQASTVDHLTGRTIHYLNAETLSFIETEMAQLRFES